MQIGIRETSSLNYIPGLDGVRAIAVLLVMLFHFTAGAAPMLAPFGYGWQAFGGIAKLGWVGVDIFFVLSGYLIAKVLETRPVGSLSAYASFIGRRFRRLAPPYIFCLVVFSIVAWAFVPESKVFKNQHLLWTLTANIEGSFGERNPLGDGSFALFHFWSLAVEWHFYLLFPVIIWVAGSVKRAALFLVAVALGCRLAFVHYGLSDNALYAFTLCRIDSLAMGTLLACVNVQAAASARKSVGLIGATAFVALMGCVASGSVPFKTLTWLQTVGYTAVALSIAMVMFAVVASSCDSRLVAALEQRWLVWIGRASYSLYIWHMVFFPTIFATIAQRGLDPRAQYLATFAVSMLVTFAAGWISFKFVETPFLRRPNSRRRSMAGT